MGWQDPEVERLRRIVAELEAKNASLVEENLELKRSLKEGAAPPEETSGGAPRGAAPPPRRGEGGARSGGEPTCPD